MRAMTGSIWRATLAARGRVAALVAMLALGCGLVGVLSRAEMSSASTLGQKVVEFRDLAYDPDSDVKLDMFVPESAAKNPNGLPTIMWIHGGGWVGGSKKFIEPYAKRLAAFGYTTVAIDYSLPPGARYPTPVRQAFKALAFLSRGGPRLGVDPQRIVLGGDSAGAQIAAQVAAVATSPSYAKKMGIAPTVSAKQIRGVVLYSGAYDLKYLGFDDPIGDETEAPLALYSGSKDYRDDPKFATFSVVNYVTGAFPPTFLSAGNADPFEPQSVEMAKRLRAKGVKVDDLLFPKDYKPPLPHVFQFKMDSDAGRFTMLHALIFLAKTTQPR